MRTVRAATAVIVTILGCSKSPTTSARGGVDKDLAKKASIAWTPFTPEAVAQHRLRQQPVFVNFTAEWDANAKVNDVLVFETDAVRAAFRETQVVPMKADWTNEDKVIAEWLRQLGRGGIPAYAIYLPDGTVDLLPQIITPSLVAERLAQAARPLPKGGIAPATPVCPEMQLAVAYDLDAAPVKDGRIQWVAFSPERVAVHRRLQQPVFVDFTADWSANSKANEAAVLETDGVRSALEKTRVLPMRADMTDENELISAWLEDLGREAIPAYAIYLPDGTFDLLPQVITAALVAERLEQAGKKFPRSGFLSLEQACRRVR